MSKRRLIIVILFLLVLSTSVSALDKTKLFGLIAPNERISLTLSYSSNGMRINDQLVIKEADQYGQWEYKMTSDMGEIHVVARSNGFQESYDVLSGKDFEIDLLGYGNKKEENETATTENETNEEKTNEEKTEGEKKEEKSSSAISGTSVFENLKINNSGFGIILVFIALFITIIIANLVSHGIINLSGRVKERRIESKKEINIVKLSDRLAEQKAENPMREEETRKKRDYEEWRRRQIEKERKIVELKNQEQRQEQINKLKEQLRQLEGE